MLGIVVFADFCRVGEPFQLSSDYVFFFFILAFPGLIVAAAYVHAVRDKAWGFILLLVGGLLTNALLFAFAAGILWALAIFNDILGLLAMILEFVLVLIASAAAVAAFMSRDPFGTSL